MKKEFKIHFWIGIIISTVLIADLLIVFSSYYIHGTGVLSHISSFLFDIAHYLFLRLSTFGILLFPLIVILSILSLISFFRRRHKTDEDPQANTYWKKLLVVFIALMTPLAVFTWIAFESWISFDAFMGI